MAGAPGPLLGIEHVEQIEHIFSGQRSSLGAREYMTPGAATRDATFERTRRVARVAQIDQRGTAHRIDLDDPAGARFPDQPYCMIWIVRNECMIGTMPTGFIEKYIGQHFLGCAAVQEDVDQLE